MRRLYSTTVTWTTPIASSKLSYQGWVEPNTTCKAHNVVQMFRPSPNERLLCEIPHSALPQDNVTMHELATDQ